MHKQPGSGHIEQLWRFAQFCSGFVSFYKANDLQGMEMAMRKIADIMASMLMSVSIAEDEAVRQALMEDQLELDYNRLKEDRSH